MSCDLAGLSVLVTRPREQADALCEAIEAARGRPVRLPAIEIEPPGDPERAAAVLGEADRADLLIFVSANAVRHAFELLPEILPETVRIAAVGRATARALDELGLAPDLVPADSFNTEGLLALPELQQMAGRQVIIVRGEGGRETLRETLEARGARVTYAEVYRRRCARRDTTNLERNWAALAEAVVVTSVEVLDCLWGMLGEAGRRQLCDTPLVVLSGRIADHARALGCRQVVVTARADDRAILDSLCALVDHS